MESLKELGLDDIQVGLQASDWEDAIRKASKPLLNRGIIKEEYVDGMVHSVEEYGPYIVLAPHVALAHARPEDGALDTGLFFSSLDPAIDFGSGENDPVKLLVVLAAKDSESHVRLLAELAGILGREDVLEKMLTAGDRESFLAAIKEAVHEDQ